MSDDYLISIVRKFAVENSEKNDIHGYAHVERVYNTCVKIGKTLNANLKVLKMAALLHDIGRIDEEEDILNRNHAEISAEKTKKFLASNKFNLAQEDCDNIIHAIRTHSFSNNISPQTLEAKILSDSDKLDAIGAIGIFRTIGFTLQNNGGIDQVIEHFDNKILNLREQMFLDYSKKIAEIRHKTVLEFYNKKKKEKS
ncbi:MAG: HD domain-containing protein [Promethearchaeota archaeon]